MRITQLDGGIIYIEDAFPMHKEFLQALEDNEKNTKINSVIPEWSEWLDGKIIDGVWVGLYPKGFKKQVDWDYSINKENFSDPTIFGDKRTLVNPDYSKAHLEAYNILKMIDEPYREVLDIWSELTDNSKMDWVTKNYTIKKYTQGAEIGTHKDVDSNKHINTQDWTALVYLNDDYEGGDLVFNDLGHRISPKAGSIIFFSTDEAHTAEKVLSGNKYFLFFYIQSKYKFSHSLEEKFVGMVDQIKSGKLVFK